VTRAQLDLRERPVPVLHELGLAALDFLGVRPECREEPGLALHAHRPGVRVDRRDDAPLARLRIAQNPLRERVRPGPGLSSPAAPSQIPDPPAAVRGDLLRTGQSTPGVPEVPARVGLLGDEPRTSDQPVLRHRLTPVTYKPGSNPVTQALGWWYEPRALSRMRQARPAAAEDLRAAHLRQGVPGARGRLPLRRPVLLQQVRGSASSAGVQGPQEGRRVNPETELTMQVASTVAALAWAIQRRTRHLAGSETSCVLSDVFGPVLVVAWAYLALMRVLVP
jgi:hypothetical protein